METHIAILEEITNKIANVCLYSFLWNVNTINEIYSIGDDSMAELKKEGNAIYKTIRR